MKKIIALMVFAVMILLTFSSCTEGNISSTETSSNEVSSNDNTSSENKYLTDEELAANAIPYLDIPKGVQVTYKVSETYFHDLWGEEYKNIDFYENDVLVAHTSVGLRSGEIVGVIYSYKNNHSKTAEINFYEFFEDENFAWYIASHLDKKPNESVTEEELASLTGKILVPMYIKSLVGIGYLKSITELSISKSDIRQIPSEITKCKNLKRLDCLKSYFLEKLPESIGELESLEFINLALSGVDELPESIGDLKNLKYLYAVGTGITNVPESIGNCESLVVLDLHSNKITKIPDSITKLKNLKSLDLGQLDLTSLPENMGNLTELIRLDLFGSDIKQLPQSMKNLTKLEYLNVYDNYNLNEDYKQWFKNECYKCTTDPGNSKDWDDGM